MRLGIGLIMSFATVAAIFPIFACAQDTAGIEQRLEALTRTVTDLQKIVEQQNDQLREQWALIDELKQQMYSPEAAAMMPPHLDEELLRERARIGEQIGDLQIAVGVTGIVQGSIDAEDVSREDNDSIDASWSSDIEIQSPVGERGLAFLLIEAGQGEGLTDELAVYQNVNDDALENGGRLEISEVWYQHYFVPERLYLAGGKVDMTYHFDANEAANDERYEFLNSALVNSLAIEFPDNGPGLVVAAIPAEWVTLRAGWGKCDWEDLDKDAFGIAQVDFRPLLFGRPGNYRFYAWLNNSDKPKLNDGSNRDGWGAGISFDQLFTRHVIGFLRFGFQDEDVYEIETAWSSGAKINGALWGREEDVLGLAVAQVIINDEIEPNDNETLFEAYYSFAMNEWLHLSPDLQVIANPGGNDENDTLVVLGTRAQVDF